MPSLIGTTSGGVSIAANYLKAVQSPGAALEGLTANDTVPLLTFSTPNLRLYKVVVDGVDLTASPANANSNWSKAVRGLQVTSELFAVFAPAVDGEGVSTFCYMAPAFNTNEGAVVSSTGNGHIDAVTEAQRQFGIVEKAIADAVGLSASAVAVTRVALTGTAVA